MQEQFDEALYTYCIRNSDDIQRELGTDGIIAAFRDPLRGFQVSNYQLIVNVLPELRSMAREIPYNPLMGERYANLVGYCCDSFAKHDSNLEKAIESKRRLLWNPISCFGAGIRKIVVLPIDVLFWCGVISLKNTQVATGSKVFNVISKLITLIGLIGSIITIALGWDQFVQLIKHI